MQGMTKMIPELFVMLKLTKVEIKREHQVLMIDKTASFKRRAKGKKGNFKWKDKQAVTPAKKPKAEPKPKLSAFTAKEMVTRNGNTLNIWWISRMAE